MGKESHPPLWHVSLFHPTPCCLSHLDVLLSDTKPHMGGGKKETEHTTHSFINLHQFSYLRGKTEFTTPTFSSPPLNSEIGCGSAVLKKLKRIFLVGLGIRRIGNTCYQLSILSNHKITPRQNRTFSWTFISLLDSVLIFPTNLCHQVLDQANYH